MLKEAFALHQQGRFAEAERLYARVLAREPGNFQALHLMGVLALQMGQAELAVARFRKSLAVESRQPLAHRDLGNALQLLNRPGEALASFDSALALKPDLAEAHNNRGAALAALGRQGDALAAYGRAIALKPDYAQAHNNRGAMLAALKRPGDALGDFSRAIALDPGYVKAINNRGAALVALNRHDEALADHDRAIALAPQDAQGHALKAQALLGAGRAEEALAAFDRALALDPAIAPAHDGRGTALAVLARAEEALAAHDRALALDPHSGTAHNNRGTALGLLGRLDEALEAHRHALTLDPDSAAAHNNSGTALSQLGRPEEALECYDRAILAEPSVAQAHVNGGLVLVELRRFEEALQSYDRALALAPLSGEAQFNKGQALLLAGRFADGWPLYEGRKTRPGHAPLFRRTLPQWTGAEDIAGKTLVIEAEQGMGDTIQFCRYAPLAAARGAKVILAVQAHLVRLLHPLTPRIIIRSLKESLPDCDYHAFLLSLPLVFGTEAGSIPAQIPYLHPEPELVRKWRDRIGTGGFKIGICWQGAASSPGRSFPLAMLRDISAIPGVRLISLQKGDGSEQLSTLPAGMNVESLGEDFDCGPDAFVDSAAVMANLDLVISCDTAMAHLAGALGRPVWVALKFAAECRWLLDRADSPWYPGMRLFRQETRGDWPGVFAAMLGTLKEIRS